MTVQPMNTVYAFVTTDPDTEQEALLGMRVRDHWQPLISCDPDEVPKLSQIARRLAADTKREVRLLRFTQREELPI